MKSHSGCGAAWLARLSGGQEVVGSNPASPTITVEAMCGRFVGSFRVEDLIDELETAASDAGVALRLPDVDKPLLENFNVAPTHVVPVLLLRNDAIECEVMQWGLVPSWAKDPKIGSKMINARAESIREKVSFKNLVDTHRCLIPMSGFYEWNRSGPSPKQPYYVTRDDGHLLLVAGIWARSPQVDAGLTFSAITRESGDDLAPIHHRTPAHFSADTACEWLLGEIDTDALIDAESQPHVHYYAVNTAVNSVKNTGVALIAPMDQQDAVEAQKKATNRRGHENNEHPRLF